MRHRSVELIPLCALVLISAAAPPRTLAQAVPTLTAPKPVSIQRGQSLDVTLTGSHLAAVTSTVVTQDSDLTTTLAKSAEKPDAEIKLTISASLDATPGPRELRLVSSTGVSAPIQVWVEQFPLVIDTAPNADPTKAQPVALPAVITGVIDAPGDSDCYRFIAAKGQMLVFNVVASRSRNSGLDANLILYDAATGRELASNNDTFGPDPLIAFEVPAGGEYVIEIRDLQFRGTQDYTYRIEAGAIPFVQSLSPTSARRGTVVDVKAVGFNLTAGSTDTIRVDLANVPPGRIPLRVKTAAGFSNELPFEVTELPQVSESEPNDDAKSATAVSPGSDVSGLIGKPGDADFYRFKLDQPKRILIDAVARRAGSPLDALLTLHDAAGKVIATNDDAAGADARLGRELAAGEYVLSVRDIAYAGGPEYAYRVSLQPTLAAPDAPPQDFDLKFQPDAPRICRGGYAKLWCDVTRQNFPTEVTLTVEGLPPGVTVASPTAFAPVTSGILMLAATADAPLGVYPITIKATAPLGGRLATRPGQPENNSGRPVQQAYLTVLDAAPLSVAPLATIPPQRAAELSAQIAALATKVLAPSPDVDARQLEWEKKIAATTTWTTLDPATFTSEGRADLVKQPDGTILARGGNPETETYTVVANTDLKAITAIRLECLPDASLGGRIGPGRAVNGNFVLTQFAATIAPKSDPGKTTPIKFSGARATFSQDQFEVANAIDDKPATGWAVAPQLGKQQTAIFLAKAPAGSDGGSVLTVTIDQNYGSNHVIGRFRLSVTSDANAADVSPVPESVLAAAKVPAAERTPQQKALLGIYYRSIDPVLAPDIARLELLRTLLAPQAEIARLQAALDTQTPELDAEQARWEQSIAAGVGWTPLDATDLRSAAGAGFAKESDGSVFVFGANPPTDTYTLVAPTALKGVTGLRVEALPDPRLPGNGPGRAANGNFILSGVRVSAAPTATPSATQPVEIASASATFEQNKYPISHALDDKPETGWAILPFAGRPAAAELFFKTPVGAEGGSTFTITLDHQASGIPMHTLGRFRLSLTTAADPDGAQRIPANILALLKLKPAQRNDAQKAELAEFHRRRARSLQPVRLRLDELRAAAPQFPLVIKRGLAGQLPVAITRGPALATGDVAVTLEGFTLGRDRETGGPAPIGRSIKVTPLTISGGNVVGALSFSAEQNAEQGTRLVVLRCESKVGDEKDDKDAETIVQYSPAFPLTVN